MRTKKAYSREDISITEALYTYCLEENLADGWAESDKYDNFQKLIEIADRTRHPLKGASVLDVGCGTGDLVSFLQEHGIGEYLGIDIVKASIDIAYQKHPRQVFDRADFLKIELEHKYDFVFASGTLAAILDTDNYAVMEAFIEKMWASARVGVAFNFLTPKYEGQTDDTLFLYDLDRVLASCGKVASGAKIEHHLNHAGYDSKFLQAHVYLYGSP
jgi:SAM-dependent methyltransferase